MDRDKTVSLVLKNGIVTGWVLTAMATETTRSSIPQGSTGHLRGHTSILTKTQVLFYT